MGDVVKQDRRAARRAQTEMRFVEAATELFVERGYAATTLADVAECAGLAPRTLYLRFATKADLFQRCIGVAIATDADAAPIAERPWMTATMTAPTLSERVGLMATVTASLMSRSGDLLAVAQQAAATEPAIAAAAQAGRNETRRVIGEFWRRIDADGLLPAGCDIEWLTETATLLAHADTFLLLQRTTGWDIPSYQNWLEKSWTRLVTGSTEPVGSNRGNRTRGTPPRRTGSARTGH
jgi:AcrR family transcriptional regulator